MKGKFQFLSGLHNDQHRAVVGDLIDQGWSPARTGSGHIKLSHPEAARPIYASSTPSDRNAGANLKRSAARVLRMSAMPQVAVDTNAPNTIEAMVTPMSKPATCPPGYMPAPLPKKKKRWTEEDRVARQAAELLAKEKHAEQSAKRAAEKEQKKAFQQEKAAAKMIATPAPVLAPAVVKEPVIMAAEEFKVIEAVTPRMITPTAVLEIEEDLLELAMKIVTGHYASLDITPEMVGGYLLIEGDAFMTGVPTSGFVIEQAAPMKVMEAPKPAVQSPIAPLAPRTPFEASMVTKEGAMEEGQPRAEILNALRSFGGKGVSCREVAEKLYADPSHAQAERVRHQLNKLIRDGYANSERTGRMTLFFANNGQ